MNDWFRKTTWAAEDRADFEARLARARTRSRAQYLRIQAYHLAETDLHREALSLLERLLAEYPEGIELAASHVQRAECLEALGELEQAEAAFHAAVSAERSRPNVLARAAFLFPFFVARHCRRNSFDDALAVLREAEAQSTFAMDRFQIAGARALIAESVGARDEARRHASEALSAAEESRSSFARHPTVGLVPPEHALIPKLRRLAG